MTDLPDLMHRNLLGVFNQRDAALRRPLMDELYIPTATFTDHDGGVSGLDAIEARIVALHERTPGFVFTPLALYEVQGLGSLAWTYGPEGASPVVTGTDIALVEGGRITALYTYLTND